jgi:hypothetical protein
MTLLISIIQIPVNRFHYDVRRTRIDKLAKIRQQLCVDENSRETLLIFRQLFRSDAIDSSISSKSQEALLI